MTNKHTPEGETIDNEPVDLCKMVYQLHEQNKKSQETIKELLEALRLAQAEILESVGEGPLLDKIDNAIAEATGGK